MIIKMACCNGYCFARIFNELQLDFASEFYQEVAISLDYVVKALYWTKKRGYGEKFSWFKGDEFPPFMHSCIWNNLTYFWKTFSFLMNTFRILNPRKLELVVSLLHLGYDFYTKYGGRHQCVHPTLTERQFQHEENTVLSENDLETLMRVSYAKLRDTRSYQNVVWKLVLRKQMRLLDSFLRYGVAYIPPPNDRTQWLNLLDYLDYLVHWKRDMKHFDVGFRHPWNGLTDFRPTHRILTVFRVIQIITLDMKEYNGYWISDDLPQWKRPRVEHETDSSKSSPSRFQCLRLLFNTIPDPYVRSQEVWNLFRLAWKEDFDMESEMYINEIVSYFEEAYADAIGPVTPRSLKHLSRCQVRENYRQCGMLPYGIHDLGLPYSIKEYIVLEEDKNPF